MEAENNRLRQAAETTQAKLGTDREVFAKRYESETKIAKQKESELRAECSSLESRLSSARHEVTQATERK
ncbi:MAG: hypothetical protein V2I33_23360 [Kangiellaceae bacterium]|jgi:hypothetical protein|nr:hypothetical protein [Kangiellaceae bacterium]